MSGMDYQHNKEALLFFSYKRMNVIGATNSLKFQRSNLRGRGKPYIWIDPPWVLFKGGDVISTSQSYPRHTNPAYLTKHREWVKGIHLLDGKRLLKVSLRFDGATIFRFSHGFLLYSYPSRPDDDGQSDYEQWYAKVT